MPFCFHPLFIFNVIYFDTFFCSLVIYSRASRLTPVPLWFLFQLSSKMTELMKSWTTRQRSHRRECNAQGRCLSGRKSWVLCILLRKHFRKQSLLEWVELHGAAAGEENLPAVGIQMEVCFLSLRACFISLLIKWHPTLDKQVLCCLIHVELVCSGPDSVYIVRGMHWSHKHKCDNFRSLFCCETEHLVSPYLFVHNESVFHFRYPNYDLLETFFVLLQRRQTDQMFFLIGWGRKDYFFKYIFSCCIL